MAAPATRTAGGATIETWTVHCPDCGAPVPVEGEATAVPCPKCHAVFRPRGVPTVAPGVQAEAAPKDPSDSLVGATLGRWRLERLLGRGGMGRVYEARDPQGRAVALKVLPQDLAEDPSFVRRFHRESKLLAGMSHPHVVEVIDGGEAGGRLWFAMEYIRGENLRRRIERGPLDPEEAARIAGEIASALSYAHGRGVIHRDLKPENVLLDEEGHVHLADFGLSRLVRDGAHEASTLLTRTDVILGTYEYMAPEQRRGEKGLDGRADVFALGVILYEMLTGRLPLGRFTPASQAVKGVPEAFDAVVNRALAPEPAGRFADAAEFRGAVLGAGKGPRPRGHRPPPLPVPSQDLADARRVLPHVDVLAGLDRALAIFLLLGFLGLVAVGQVLGGAYHVLPLGGVVLLVGSVVFFRVGGRLADLAPGSRESQITSSVVLLFFPPFLTAMGVYGLWVLTSERARRAFALGRGALTVSEAAPRPPPLPKEPARDGPTVLHRLLLLVSVLWALWMGLVVLDNNVFTPSTDDAALRTVRDVTFGWCVLSCAVLAHAWLVRRRRRAVGIALTAALLFAGSLAMVERAIDAFPRIRSALDRPVSERLVRTVSPPIRWEFPR